MKFPDGIPNGITRKDVLDALKALDNKLEHGFDESTGYDVVYQGHRYAPKAVIGVAARRLAGRILRPDEFVGGRYSKVARILHELDFVVEEKPDSLVLNAYWWVNHKKTYRLETAGNFLWSPKTSKNQRQNKTYDTMTYAAPGDIVFSYAGGQIKAIGWVTARASTTAKPKEFGSTGKGWDHTGWRLPVVFSVLETPLRPKEHMDRLAPVLPAQYSPIKATGDGNQSVYLASIPTAMAAELRVLLTGQLEAVESKRREVLDDAAEQAILDRPDIGETEKTSLVKARRGQGLFRERVIALERRCRLTAVEDVNHLRASHIKPWKVSSDKEKLDGNNGLLLAPHVDHLFDRGYISFSDVGDVLVSPKCPAGLLSAWGLRESINVGPFREMQHPYLAFHRKLYSFEP